MPPKQEGMIFKATYSGVPVYECIIKGVAVMRRRQDDWINATHVLKVVGLDKPQRTRVLERDVQKGTHEKVQGGYGKYQGTWIPLESAIALAKTYNLSHLFNPLTSYKATGESPPPAPKHVVASSSRSKKAVAAAAAGMERARRATSIETESELASAGKANGTEGSMSPSPSDVSSTSRTPSPIAHERLPAYYDDGRSLGGGGGGGRGGNAAGRAGEASSYQREPSPATMYAEIILDYFISESTTIPPLLVSPPPDYDANMSIDDDEHTALHWACAMGRIRVVKLLLSAGADVFRVNASGQTALMRAAMFSNNYDLRKFPELFELLHRSILNIDRSDRTVFHHVVDLALSRGKPHAARYYMETMVHRLAEYGSQLADILNFQDDEGETPLTIAARARSKRITKLLLEHGADPKIRNKEGKNAEDYIVEDERFRATPPRGASADGVAGAPTGTSGTSMHTSEAGQRAGGKAVALMATLLNSLADSYDAELGGKDRQLQQAHALLAQIQTEIAESARTSTAEGNADATPAQINAAGKTALERAQTTLGAGVEKRTRDEMARDWDEAQGTLKKQRIADGTLTLTADEGLAAPSADVARETSELREKLAALKQKRSDVLVQFVTQAREQGAGKQALAYRRLIAAGNSGLQTEEVDNVVSALLELLDQGGEAAAAANGTSGENMAALLKAAAGKSA